MKAALKTSLVALSLLTLPLLRSQTTATTAPPTPATAKPTTTTAPATTPAATTPPALPAPPSLTPRPAAAAGAAATPPVPGATAATPTNRFTRPLRSPASTGAPPSIATSPAGAGARPGAIRVPPVGGGAAGPAAAGAGVGAGAAAGGRPPGGGAGAAGGEGMTVIQGGEIEDDVVREITFSNAPLEQVLDYYSTLSGRTVLKPNALVATITLKTQSELSRQEAVQALDSVLALNGVTMIPVGEKFVKAVPPQQALQEGAAFSKVNPETLPEADQFITQIVQLKNASPQEVIPSIQGLAKNPAGILGVESSRTIILRDYAANVKRMMEVIQKIDIVPEMDYKLEVIPIKFGRVEEIYSTMSSLISGGGGGGASAGGATASRRTAGSGGTRSSSRLAGQQNNRMGQTQLGGQTQVGAQPGANQNSFQNRLQQIVNRASSGGEMQLLGDARIVPDERGNRLIVFANKQDMEMITNLVSKVDVLLAQVLIEAIIVDVGYGSSWQFGVSTVQNPQSSQNGNLQTGGGINNGQTLFGSLKGLTNFAGGLPGGFSYVGQWKDDFNVTMQAIASDNKAQVVQTPRIQTSHAVPASFFSGETRPYPTGSYGGYYGGVGAGTTGFPSVNYQQLEVGVGLDVTPYITPDDLVVMEITQTIDGIIGTEELANVGKVPITSRRTATATVSVRNKDTIMLGGFINTQNSKTKSGVPILKDIPGLGALFRNRTSDKKRSELIILMRPTILPTPKDAALVAKSERDRLPGVAEAEQKFTEDVDKRLEEKNTKDREREKDKEKSKARSNGSK